MSSLAASDHPEAPLFSDGIGERVVAVDGATGELLQILRLRPALLAVPSFEFALRERTARLANFRHAYYARVRRVDRGMPPASSLAIVSDHIEGTRLSDILRVAHERGLQLDISAALCLIRQLVPAVAVLHENARDVAHGLLAPERLIVTPNARLVIVEHVLGAAIEQLQFGRDRLWQDFRIAMPLSAGLPRFDHRADVTGMGLVALALILGRPLDADEFPHQIPSLLNEARERSALGEEQPLSPPLRTWLSRALQVDVRRAFASAPEAMAAFEELVADDSMYVAAPVALETFLSRFSESLLEGPAPPRAQQVESSVASWHAALEEPSVPNSSWHAALEEPIVPRSRSFDPPAAQPESFEAPTRLNRPGAGFRIDDFATTTPFEQIPVNSWEDESDSWEDEEELPPAPVASRSVPPVHDITDLLGPEPLPEVEETIEESRIAALRPLFDPDGPFTAAASVDAPAPPRRSGPSLIAIAAIVVALAGGAYAGLKWFGRSAGAPPMGALVVQSNPAGVQVFVDGIEHGRTPARVTLEPGSHILELRGRGVPRVIPLTITPGAEVSQYLEFAEAPVVGQLAVQSEPAGAKVLVDGVERGVAPVTVRDLAPGDHVVELQSEGVSTRHTVNVQAGATASLLIPIVPAATAGPVSGWIAVKAPFTMEIREGGRLLGSSDTDRVMMAAGRHELELVSDTLGYRATRVVQVLPGKVAAIAVDLPQGVMNLNASPWAEVWIDGTRVGETPIGNLSVAIGPHEIVFKHPQLGEKRQAVSVTLGAPIRLSVDMK
jgi:serine/threonine protein kinase